MAPPATEFRPSPEPHAKGPPAPAAAAGAGPRPDASAGPALPDVDDEDGLDGGGSVDPDTAPNDVFDRRWAAVDGTDTTIVVRAPAAKAQATAPPRTVAPGDEHARAGEDSPEPDPDAVDFDELVGRDPRRVVLVVGLLAIAALVVAGIVLFATGDGPRPARPTATTAGLTPVTSGPATTADPCPDNGEVAAQLTSSIPEDAGAGAALAAAYTKAGRATLGCPGAGRQPVHQSRFWVLELDHGSNGSSLLVVNDSGSVRDPSQRGATVIPSTARPYFAENLATLTVAENRRSFGVGDIQVFQFVSGGCAGLVRTDPNRTPSALPPAVFDVGLRLANRAQAVPTLVSQRTTGNTTVFTLGFASLVGGTGPSPVSTNAVPTADVRLTADGTATSGTVRSRGAPCPVAEVVTMQATAKRLADAVAATAPTTTTATTRP